MSTTITAALVCDFCGETPPRETLTWYPCRTFTRLSIRRGRRLILVPCECCADLPEPAPGDKVERYTSLSAWVACAGCRPYLDTGDYAGLIAHVAGRLCAGQASDQAGAVMDAIVVSHAGYWQHRQPQN